MCIALFAHCLTELSHFGSHEQICQENAETTSFQTTSNLDCSSDNESISCIPNIPFSSFDGAIRLYERYEYFVAFAYCLKVWIVGNLHLNFASSVFKLQHDLNQGFEMLANRNVFKASLHLMRSLS